jgi:hypothetical protein
MRGALLVKSSFSVFVYQVDDLLGSQRSKNVRMSGAFSISLKCVGRTVTKNIVEHAENGVTRAETARRIIKIDLNDDFKESRRPRRLCSCRLPTRAL